MLKIKAYPAPSRTHGLGLFAGQDIESGSTVWEFSHGIDRVMSIPEFLRLCRSLEEEALSHMLSSSYKRNDKFYFLVDNTRFINHDEDNYNLVLVDDMQEVATRDIREGEELLENYFLSYDSDDFFNYELNNVSMYEYLDQSLAVHEPRADRQYLSG